MTAPIRIADQAPFVAGPGRIHVPRAVSAVKRAANTAGTLAAARLPKAMTA